MATIKLIHPKTEAVREIDESDLVRLKILTRAGFVDAKTHQPLPDEVLVPPPTLVEVVEEEAAELEIPGVDAKAEKAVHAEVVSPEKKKSVRISPSVRKLIEKEGLDPSLIKGTGKKGAIKKVDVLDYLESVKK